MKTIVAGSRDFNDYDTLEASLNEVVDYGWSITYVVSGTARGADALGEQWANYNEIEVIQFPAKWDEHGKSAGYRRNEIMAKYADALVAFWDGKSKGTKHMIDIAIRRGLYVKVFYYERDDDEITLVSKGT